MARTAGLPPTVNFATLPPTVDPGAGRGKMLERAAVSKGMPIRGAGGEQYLILDKIDDSGAQGDVYLARRHNSTYAIKIYHAEFSPCEEVLTLLERNECPHIAKLVERGMHDDTFYFEVYPHYSGGTLADLIAQGKCTQSFIRRTLLPSLDEALRYLHANGLVHGDLKPANIFVTSDGSSVVLGDFGVASVLPKGSSTTTFRGTLEYAPPVEHEGNTVRIGPAYDYGALGLILLEAYTGNSPFAGKTLAERDRDWLTFDVRRFTSVPGDVRTLIEGLLDRHERSRYGHDQVQRFLTGGRGEKGWRPRRPGTGGASAPQQNTLELGFVGGRMHVARDLADLLRFCETHWEAAKPLLSDSPTGKLGRFLRLSTGSDDLFNGWVGRFSDDYADERMFMLCAALRERCEGQGAHQVTYREGSYRSIVHLLGCVRSGEVGQADDLLAGNFLPAYLTLFGYGADVARQVADVISTPGGAPSKAARILGFLTETPQLTIAGKAIGSVRELRAALVGLSMPEVVRVSEDPALDSWLYSHKCTNVLNEMESFNE